MKPKIIPRLASLAILTAISTSTWAAGTTAGTSVNNTASISYSVGGATQTDIESSSTGNSNPGSGNGTPTTFVVDKKIDLIVTGPGSNVNVTPNTSGNDLVFQVTNEGNSAEDFSLTISEIAGGDFDANTCTASPSSFTALAVDTPTNVTVSCTIPNSGTADNGGVANAGTVANTNTSVIDLLATVTGVTASTGADTAGCISGTPDTPSCVVDVVFADGTGTTTDNADRNAKHSATGTYVVNTADLTVQKTEAVSKMSFDLNDDNTNETDVTTGNLYHIPGSTIEYTVTVTNADGAAAARSIVLSDTLQSDLTFVSCTASGDAVLDTVFPAAVSTTATTPTCSAAGQVVTTSSFTLPGGSGSTKQETITITATVN